MGFALTTDMGAIDCSTNVMNFSDVMIITKNKKIFIITLRLNALYGGAHVKWVQSVIDEKDKNTKYAFGSNAPTDENQPTIHTVKNRIIIIG